MMRLARMALLALASCRVRALTLADTTNGRHLSVCTIDSSAPQYSVITEGSAQLSGKIIVGALHIGGTVSSSPRNYNQRVSAA